MCNSVVYSEIAIKLNQRQEVEIKTNFKAVLYNAYRTKIKVPIMSIKN